MRDVICVLANLLQFMREGEVGRGAMVMGGSR